MNLVRETGNTTQFKDMMDILKDAGEIRFKPGQPVIIKVKKKPRESNVKEVFQSRSFPPNPKIKRIRKNRKHLRNISTSELQNEIEDCRESKDTTRNIHPVRTEVYVNDPIKEFEDSVAQIENRRINTSDLRRFTQEKLPPSSILGEALKQENDELTVDEFLAKLDIWCLLFRKDTGG